MPKRLSIALFLLVRALTLFGAAPQSVPAPESVFGFKPGADMKMATYDQTIAYLKQLAAASPLLKIVEAGRTSQGRVASFALISSAGNLGRIDRLREIARRLAHPEGLTDDEARRLAREGRAFVHIDGGCHATEVAGAQMMPQLAYDLVSRADEHATREILDNVIFFLWPTMNPDGQQMVGEWHLKNLGTPYEQSGLPRLYQEYVGHDNNRDGYMLNMIESRMMEHFWRQWEPQIVYVHHQTAPFPARIWLPPFSEPVGLEAPYLSSREVNMIGMAIEGFGGTGHGRCDPSGHEFRCVVSGLRGLRPDLQEHPGFLDRDGGQHGRAPGIHPERSSRGGARPADPEPLR